ncbi:MAG: hypothetical protein VX374_05925, partial [Pseudomonadota bacterium]|nr:hypothetical protein [Pseudomonadota bacterium]
MLDQAAIDVLRNQPVAEQGHFVNGAFAASREGATLEVLSPIDGKPLTRIASGTAADVGVAQQRPHCAPPPPLRQRCAGSTSRAASSWSRASWSGGRLK